MTELLIVYNTMGIGGSTTSLLSFLRLIDYSKYKIDLMLAINIGELLDMIPNEVNVLEPAWPDDIVKKKRSSFRSIITRIYGSVVAKICGKSIVKDQYMGYENARLSRRIEKKYDIAISYLENFPLNYVGNYVQARKKIAWIHVDYLATGFYPKIDRKCLGKFDNVVLVSDECKCSFDRAFPEYACKSVAIPNILSAEYVRNMSRAEYIIDINENKINIVTVCRISYEQKGLYRVVDALKKLKDIGKSEMFHWYVVGDGQDFDYMQQIVETNKLNDCISMLGKMVNPMPVIKKMDMFLLPSLYEGKPMSVTEAQMLEIPPIVTSYASADGQIVNGYDGIIIPNNDEAVFSFLKSLVDDMDSIKKIKSNLGRENYDNVQDFYKVCSLLNLDE